MNFTPHELGDLRAALLAHRAFMSKQAIRYRDFHGADNPSLDAMIRRLDDLYQRISAES